jgi:hypothetical protein
LYGFESPYKTQEDRDNARRRASILLVVFIILSVLLLSSIILTIKTNPGGIPDDKEWDMMSDSHSDYESD